MTLKREQQRQRKTKRIRKSYEKIRNLNRERRKTKKNLMKVLPYPKSKKYKSKKEK